MNILSRIEKENGLKPKEVAVKLGITKSYYSMIRNNIRPISKGIAIKIYEVFNIPLEQILSRPEVNDTLSETGTDCK